MKYFISFIHLIISKKSPTYCKLYLSLQILFMYFYIKNRNPNKNKKPSPNKNVIHTDPQTNHSDTLYLSINNINFQECDEENKKQVPQKFQQILKDLQQSKILEIKGYSEAEEKSKIKNGIKQNKQKEFDKHYINDKNGKPTLKPTHMREKLQQIERQYMDSLFKQFKCTKHLDSEQYESNPQQIFICLQNTCECSTNNESKIVEGDTPKQDKRMKKRATNLNQRQKAKKQQNKGENVKAKSYVQSQMQVHIAKFANLNKFLSRILCQECLIEKLHRGHRICPLKKFRELISEYHWASTQASKTILSKINQLKTNIDSYFNIFSNKAIEIMTIGLFNDWQEYRSNFSNYNLTRKLSSKLLHKKKENGHLNVQFEFQSHTNSNRSTPSQNKKAQSNFNTQISQNIEQILSNKALQIWQQLLNVQNSSQIQAKINKILTFKQESILQQIEWINANFKDNVTNCITNLEFVNNFKDWTFNPNDMAEGGIGLTLDRNKIEGTNKKQFSFTNEMRNTKKRSSPTPSGFMRKWDLQNNCQIAFTQTPLTTQYPRSFKIQHLNEQILIGCVNSLDHSLIANKLKYQNYHKYLYGLSVNLEGEVKIYRRGQKPYLLQNQKIFVNDVIQIALHLKNSIVTFIKYSPINQSKQLLSEGKNTLKIQGQKYIIGKMHRSIVVTLPIQLIQNDPYYYMLAGVTVQGDCVGLTQNILDQGKIVNFIYKGLRESQLTMKNKKEKTAQSDLIDDVYDSNEEVND